MTAPYDSPFAAFTNYMNVLADFLVRVEEQYPESIDNEELNSLLLTIRNQASEINSLNKEVKTLRANILNDDTLTVVEAEEIAPKQTRKDTETKPAPRKRATRKTAKTKEEDK